MGNLSSLDVSTPTFSAAAASDGDALNLSFKGEADIEAVKQIDAFLKGAHAEAQNLSVSRVVVDFRALEFMNSSCFKCFITWLRTIQRLESDKQYRISFQRNPETHWQRRSLEALSCFAADLVTVEA